MDKKYEIIKSFQLPIEKKVLKELRETHSYIEDKLILDAVNGVNIVARDLHAVSKSRQSFLNRTFDGLFGNSRKRQDLINENFIEGINACTSWLRDHDSHMSRLDYKIGFIAKELTRTQGEILKFYAQHSNLVKNFEQLEDVFFEFEQSALTRFCELETYINDVDTRTQAFESLELELSRLRINKYSHLSLPLQIYTVLDNFTSGYGGLYYNSLQCEKRKKDFIERVSNELLSYYSDNVKNYVDYEELIDSSTELSKHQKEGLSFIATQHYNALLEQNIYYEISDLVSIVTSYKKNDALKEIEKQSNIRTFITFEEYIQTAFKEHLVA